MNEGKNLYGEAPPEEVLPETPELREQFLRAKEAARKLAATEAQERVAAGTAAGDDEDNDKHVGDAYLDRRLYRKPDKRMPPRKRK